MLRAVQAVAIALLAGPIAAGVLGVLLPAFGLLPALGGHAPTIQHWLDLLAHPGLWRSVLLSLASGLVTAGLALAVVLLFLAGAGGSRLYRWIVRAVSPLLAVPHAAAAFGLAFLIAPSGLLARLASPWATGWERPPDLLIVNDPWGLAMMAGLVVKEIPFLLLMSLAALPQVGAARRLQIARALGYRPVTAWLKAVLPALYPLIRLPVYAVIAFGTSTVEVALILGPTNPPTLAVAVLRWFYDPELAMRFLASAGAVLQLLVTLVALGLWRLGERAVGWLGRRWIEGGGRGGRLDRVLGKAGAAGIVLATAAAVAGLLGLAIASLAGPWRFPDTLPQAVTLRHWARAAPGLIDPLLTTAAIAALATLAALAVALAALENERRRRRPASPAALRILYLPLVVPQVAFMFGLVIGLELAGVRPGFWTVAAGHLVLVLPYVYLSLSEPYRRLDPRWTMVARTLGAGRGRTFWAVRLPLLLAPCLTAAAVGFAVSVGQYLVTQLLGGGRVPTVTTEAVALAAGGNRRVIGVWALLQALLPAAGFAVALAVPRLAWRRRRDMAGIAAWRIA